MRGAISAHKDIVTKDYVQEELLPVHTGRLVEGRKGFFFQDVSVLYFKYALSRVKTACSFQQHYVQLCTECTLPK